MSEINLVGREMEDDEVMNDLQNRINNLDCLYTEIFRYGTKNGDLVAAWYARKAKGKITLRVDYANGTFEIFHPKNKADVITVIENNLFCDDVKWSCTEE